MANKIIVIKKKFDFINVNKNGKAYKSNSLILKKLLYKNLGGFLGIGYTVTKKLGNAVKRNRAKRIMRELVRRNIIKYGKYNYHQIFHHKYNFYYVLIAKKAIFDTSFKNLEKEFVELLLKK